MPGRPAPSREDQHPMAADLPPPDLPDAGGPDPAAPGTHEVGPPLRIVEAMLFVGGGPLTAAQACEVVRGLTPAQFAQAVATLNRDYRLQGRPYRIQVRGAG